MSTALLSFTIVFAIASFVGVVVSSVNAWNAYKGLEALNIRGITNGRRVFAKANIRTHVMRAVELWMFLTLAVVSLLGVPTEVRRLISTVALTLIAVLIIASSVSDRVTWNRLLRDLAKHDHDQPTKAAT